MADLKREEGRRPVKTCALVLSIIAIRSAIIMEHYLENEGLSSDIILVRFLH